MRRPSSAVAGSGTATELLAATPMMSLRNTFPVKFVGMAGLNAFVPEPNVKLCELKVMTCPANTRSESKVIKPSPGVTEFTVTLILSVT